jgi:hypothetical protein
MLCDCRLAIGQRSIVYRAGAFCKPQVLSDNFQSVALTVSETAFPPLSASHLQFRTYSNDRIYTFCQRRLLTGVGTHPVIISYRIQGNK